MNNNDNPIFKAIELQQQGKIAEAESLFIQILHIKPDEAVSLYSLGIILMQRGNTYEAMSLFKRGTEAAPTFPYNWLGYASTLQALGRNEEALTAYDQAIKFKPDYVEALINSGALLRELFRHHEALQRFNQILTFDPNNLTALGNMAILLTEYKESAKAIELLQRLLTLKPNYDYGLGLLIFERLHCGDWTNFAADRQKILQGIMQGERICKSLAFMALSDAASEHFLCARIFAQHFCPQPQRPLWRGELYNHKRLRIAYVSPDLREHPVGHLMCNVFENHDKSRVEIIAISLGIDDGSRLRARMLKAFDQFVDAKLMTAKQIAEKMRALEVDIAVDLAGYTADSKIAIYSYRPAPIHINYLGYSGTLGVNYMDYILADRQVIPEQQQPFYSEKVVYLKNCYLTTDATLQIPNDALRATYHLPEEKIIFCSFSHDFKISPPLWKIWMTLLQQIPNSVLWLVSRNELTNQNFCNAATHYGISSERILFAGRVPRVEDHLARYRLADVFLDTWPYNAHSTAADALLAGLPVVTYMGSSFASRVAGSLLSSLGLTELIAHSWDDYIQIAMRLATDQTWNTELRQKLANCRKSSPLFNTKMFVSDLENVYEDLVKNLH